MFSKLNNMYEHMVTSHPVGSESPFGCPIKADCSTRFNDKLSIMDHVRDVHGVDPEAMKQSIKKMRPTLRKCCTHIEGLVSWPYG